MGDWRGAWWRMKNMGYFAGKVDGRQEKLDGEFDGA